MPEIPPTNNQPLSIQIISAGAGSGKTYTLTGRLVELLAEGVRPAGIVATTFTQKAAAELQERVRIRLLEEGLTTAAGEIGNAHIGTVHSIGVRLLQRFAFEASVSPLVEIIADGDEQRLFNEALSQVLTESRIERMNLLAERLGQHKKTTGETYDWRKEIRNLTDIARANNFSREVLEKSKSRSWESYARLLPPPQTTDTLTWNNRLISQLDQSIAALEANTADETKTTREGLEELRQLRNQLGWRGNLHWYEWVKISKIKIGARSREHIEPLQELARAHVEHKDFQADIRKFSDMLFDLAMDALSEYEQYKKKRGLIDYTDMETFVSQLLRVESVRQTLREELDLVLVDEFQDTSPIQLDIFLQLSRLARKSIWVGDPKQSIYSFRGAEPALMQAVVDATGGIRDQNILKKSWRSRPDLVYAANAIFTRAFPNLPAEQVGLEPARTDSPGFAPALQHWHFRNELDDRKVPGKPWMEDCIARQVRVTIERKLPVWDKNLGAARPVAPGDIAILCRSNDQCATMAAALHRAGLQAAIARAGLLESAEAKLVLACLKYLVTPSDQLSLAEIQVISGSQTLEELVNQRLAGDENRLDQQTRPLPAKLLTIRPLCADLSAAEILNLLLDELDLRRIAGRLDHPVQRLDNMDRLRQYALDYESDCQRLHSAASLSGFLLWLNQLGRSGNDLQSSGESRDTVRVMTYHKSKGLEAPMTICHNLESRLRERIWGINLVSERETPDLEDILGHRWLRLWINPYSDQLKNTLLQEALHASPEWTLANRQALEEDVRLLYVGLTRARDYLVVPTTANGTPWLNRVFNQGDDAIPTLDPDSSETPFTWKDKVLQAHTEIIYQPRDLPEFPPERVPIPFPASPPGAPAIPFLAFRIDPFQEADTRLAARPSITWTAPLPLNADMEPGLDTALKNFLLADDPALPKDYRTDMARIQLQIHRVEGLANPENMLRHSDALRAFLQTHFEPQSYLPRFPLHRHVDGRLLEVQADLLLRGKNGRTALLFAPFKNETASLQDRCTEWLPYAGWLQKALEAAFPGQTVQIAILFALEGRLAPLSNEHHREE